MCIGKRNARQRAAMLFAPCGKRRLALQRHGVGDQPAAVAQTRPARVEYTRHRHAAADEHRIRRRQPVECFRRAARDELQTRHAQRVAIVFDKALPLRVRFNGNRAASRMRAHPFDADRAAARAHVPQQFAGRRGEARERDRAHIAFGQLAIVAKRVIGQAASERQTRRAIRRAAFERDQVQRGNVARGPLIRAAVDAPLRVAAEMFEHGHARRAEAARVQQRGERRGRAAVRAQHEHARAVTQMRIQRRQRPADQRHDGRILQRPAKPGGGQR
ncbi:hypothetical protein ABIE53_005933 [Burkholderia sp. OAS925]